MAKELKVSWNPIDRNIRVCRKHGSPQMIGLSKNEHWRRCSRYVVIVTGPNARVYDFKRDTIRRIEKTDKKWARFAA